MVNKHEYMQKICLVLLEQVRVPIMEDDNTRDYYLKAIVDAAHSLLDMFWWSDKGEQE